MISTLFHRENDENVRESKRLFIYFFLFFFFFLRRSDIDDRGDKRKGSVLPFQKNIAAKRARVQNTNYDSSIDLRMDECIKIHKDFFLVYISKKKHFEMIPGDTTTIQAVIIQRVCTIYIFFVFGYETLR